ncbi:heme oxygenase [Bacillus massiliigorillae]|uniref:heme oxygenase n=1 Tax=Bacillus massiliigorillae TaxID=1243664 RepID=UPI00039FBF7C|nr:heme oxygenase [Bacillus massiliigorillae]
MIIVTNKSKLIKGEGPTLVNRFNKVGKVESMKGFINLEVLLTQSIDEYDEVTILTRWESKADFQAWMKSSAFKSVHSKDTIPEFIIENKITFYDVKIVREAIHSNHSYSNVIAH